MDVISSWGELLIDLISHLGLVSRKKIPIVNQIFLEKLFHNL